MAYKFVPYTPEGSGGKDPILGELTVTENKVYDNPVMYIPTDPDTIGIGSKLRFREKITLSQETADKLKPCAHSYFGGGVAINLYFPKNNFESGGTGTQIELFDDGEYALYVIAGSFTFGYVSSPNVYSSLIYDAWQMEAHKWYAYDGNGGLFPSEPPSFTVEYEQNVDPWGETPIPTSTERLKMLANDCFGTEVAIDGWNKVKIGIPGAGLIVDKQNIFDVLDMQPWDRKDGAIYRVIGMVDDATLYLNTGSEIIDVYSDLHAEWGDDFRISVVDELPQSNTDSSFVMVCIVRETGEVYEIYWDGPRNAIDSYIKSHYADSYGTDFEFRGIAESTDEITESGFYTVFGQKEKVLHYFIVDDNATVWRTNGKNWEQLETAGNS